MDERKKIQGIAAHRLAKNKRLVCMWATGTGKSGVVLRFLEDNSVMDCLILVPEQNNIENWRYEFQKFGISDEHVTVACYASLHKYEGTHWDLLVFDEAPHMDTVKRKKICQSVSGEYILALGAVIDADELDTLESVYGEFEISRISISEAIRMNILPQPKVYVLHIQLDNKNQSIWYRGRSYTEKSLYELLDARVTAAVYKYNTQASDRNKRSMLMAGSERKRFLGKCKESAVRRICDKLRQNNRRFLCFCSSIDQANSLGGDNAFTSKSSKSMRHLQKFNSHEIDSLFVVGKLIEGQNLKDIECGVIAQLGGTQRITVQEIGRIIRSDNPVVYIPVFDGTKDDSFLYTLTVSIPDNCIKHYNF